MKLWSGLGMFKNLDSKVSQMSKYMHDGKTSGQSKFRTKWFVKSGSGLGSYFVKFLTTTIGEFKLPGGNKEMKCYVIYGNYR